MSVTAQRRPEHLVIRDFVDALIKSKRTTWPKLSEVFAPIFLDMIPAGKDVPKFEAVHLHDGGEEMARKEENARKELMRCVMGGRSFPLCVKTPLVLALDQVRPDKQYGMQLRKLLLHNDGLLFSPIEIGDDEMMRHVKFMTEASEASLAIANDLMDDGILNSVNTREEILQSMEQHLIVLRAIDENREKAK